MPISRSKLRHLETLPIGWLGEGRLKLSLLLRHSPSITDKSTVSLKLLEDEHLPRNLLTELSASQSRESSFEDASRDYERCILAKSVANAYGNATARYRNEAARKQSFTRLLEIFQACHLSAPTEAFNPFGEIQEADRVGDWVKSEFDELMERRVDISSEHATHLNAARTEFRRYLKQLEEITGCSWEESQRFHKSLSVASIFPPDLAENENTWRWGTQWYADIGVLNVNPPMLFFDTIRKGLLAREAATLLSPLIFDRMPDAPRALCEQSEYFAYRLLERKNDKELWSQARHGLRRMTKLGGEDLIEFFQDHEMMVGDTLYKELWIRLGEFGTARMTIGDYRTIFGSLASRPVRHKFSPSEIRLLDLLANRPDIKAGEAARKLRLSVPTAMKAIRELSWKAALRFTVIVDMRRLGLTEHLLLIKTKKIGELLRVLSRFPFCRQVFRTYGTYDLFCVFDIPTEHSAFTRGFVDDMATKELVSEFQLVELERDFQAVNFGRYDAAEGRWNVHWDSWGMNLKESLASGTDAVMPVAYPHQPKSLDKLDLRILSSLQKDCRIPYAAMARGLGVSGAYVGRKIERMVREGVFRYALWPLKIAAEDWGIVSLTCSKSVASTLAQYLSQLPAWRGGLISGDFSGILAMVWAPSGEMKQFFKAVDDRLIRSGKAEAQCLNAVGEWVLGRWLPVDPYPWDLVEEKGDWIFDEARYRSLSS